MVFTSAIFVFLFLPLVITSYFLIRKELRNGLLLLASLFFYAWGEPKYIIIMLISIVINYCAGLMIDRYREDKTKKKSALIIGTVCNLGLLAVFKYGNFIVDNVNALTSIIGPGLTITIGNIHLPIGISFFTFQGLSYAIDVYRNEAKVQKNIFNLALYVSLFPQLIAGPIVRYSQVAEEIEEREITIDKICYGLRRFIVGFAKKIIIANQMGLMADKVFATQTEGMPTTVAWLGIICYTLQIYFDFSGYSDMAIGLGRVFGFTFLENFNYPYISKSIKEFWKRWHISLTSWFRDYLYIPLGGNRKGKARSYINQMIVFLLSGLWHGASWNFIFWGVYHGVFITLERTSFGKFIDKLWSPIRHLYALIVILVGWVFFRAANLTLAVEYLKNMFIFNPSTDLYNLSLFLDPKAILILVLAIVFSIPILKWCKELSDKISPKIYGYDVVVNIGALALFVVCLIALAGSTYNPFIYFRF